MTLVLLVVYVLELFGRHCRLHFEKAMTLEVFPEGPEWSKRFGIVDAHSPLAAAAADRLLSRIDASLPADYLELTRQANGLSVGNWEILGLSKVHSVALGERDYYILASNGDSYLAVRRGARDGLLYGCSTASEEPLAEGASFRDAIERDLREDAGES